MLQLHTLGGLWLDRGDGVPIGDVRGRWLGLLAVVAAAGNQGVTRDQVLAVLCPELDTSRGGHNLSQMLYALRRHVGQELISAEGQTLRLDRSQITADLIGFAEALGAARWSDAARIYRGPFLDGFHLDDAAEFERWTADTRDRLAADGERALEHHAEQAEKRGESAEARATWRRLVELDPLNSRFAYQLVLALAASGDRGGAVRLGLIHAARLKEELGSAPPTRLSELMTRLQQGTFVSSQQPGAGPPPSVP